MCEGVPPKAIVPFIPPFPTMPACGGTDFTNCTQAEYTVNYFTGALEYCEGFDPDTAMM